MRSFHCVSEKKQNREKDLFEGCNGKPVKRTDLVLDDSFMDRIRLLFFDDLYFNDTSFVFRMKDLTMTFVFTSTCTTLLYT